MDTNNIRSINIGIIFGHQLCIWPFMKQGHNVNLWHGGVQGSCRVEKDKKELSLNWPWFTNVYPQPRFPKFLFSYNKHFTKLEQTLGACYDLGVLSREQAQNFNSNSTNNYMLRKWNQLINQLPQRLYIKCSGWMWIPKTFSTDNNQLGLKFGLHTNGSNVEHCGFYMFLCSVSCISLTVWFQYIIMHFLPGLLPPLYISRISDGN